MDQIREEKIYCKDCKGYHTSTSWRPTRGFNPDMREFKCYNMITGKAKSILYIVVEGSASAEARDRKKLELEKTKVVRSS